MSEYFPEPKSLRGTVRFEWDSSNYATKTNLKNATDADTSKFAKKVDLANLKLDVDKLDIDKLKNVPTNLSNLKSKVDKLDVDEFKLSDAVKNYVVKKDVYYAQEKNIEDKIPGITNLTTNASPDAKSMKLKAKYLTLLIQQLLLLLLVLKIK